jgi:hypothetical protein
MFMKKYITLLILTVLIIIKGQAQNTITPYAFITNNLCAGSTIEVPYGVTGTFNTGNIFTAQLSDEFGTFSTFTNIGTVSLTSSGTINCTVPNTINTSANYLIRVISTNPPITSPDNLIPLTYFARPDAHFVINSPHRRFLQGSFIGVNNLSTNQFLCNWDFGQGATPGTDFSCAPGPFIYGSNGTKLVKLVVTSAFGCLDSFEHAPIEIFDCNPAIGPNAILVTGTVNWVPNGSQVWVCSGGVYNTNNHNNQTIFVEAGGQVNMDGGANNILYVKAGGAVSSTAQGTSHTYIYETGASITNHPSSNHAFYNCPGLTYNYCAAPLNGCFVTAPQATITPGGPTTFCIGDSVLLTANAGNTYLWSNGAVTQTTMIHSSGTYDVAVTYLNGCTRISAPVTVSVNPQPVAVVTSSRSLAFCTGDSVILSATAGMTDYLWSSGQTTQTISVLATNTFEVAITNANGCKDTSAVVSVDVNPIPGIYASGPTSFCSGDSVELATDPGVSYLWSNGATTQSIWVHNTSTLTVQVTGSTNCTLPSLPEVVTEWNLPVTTVQSSGPLVFCTGGSVILTSSPAASYLWSDGSTTQTLQTSASGTFKVILTDANLCVDSSSIITVTVNTLPDSTITPDGPLTFCSDINRTLTGPAGMSEYVWSSGVMNQSLTQSITVNASGTYGLTVRDANNCLNSSLVNVTVNQSPVPGLSSTRPLTFCEGDSTILIASGGSSYLWNTGETTSSIKVDTSGVYSVQTTTFGTCTSTPLSITATRVPMPMPVITSSGMDTICSGETVTLYGNGAQHYSWSFGSSLDSVVVSSSKINFTLTGSNGPNNMCTVTTAPYTVFVAPKPNMYYTSAKLTKCPEDSAVFTLSPVVNVNYQWHLNGAPVVGETGSIFKTSATGSVYLVATNEFNCFDTSAVKTIVDDLLPKPTLTYDPALYYMYTNDPTFVNYRWTRNDTILAGVTGSTYTAQDNGVHKVWVRSQSGCYTASDPFSYTWVSTENMIPVSNWKAFPNPASDYIRITTEGEDADFVLTDMQGRALRTGFISGAGEVMVQDLPAGVYHLKVTSGNRLAQFKIQVMH